MNYKFLLVGLIASLSFSTTVKARPLCDDLKNTTYSGQLKSSKIIAKKMQNKAVNCFNIEWGYLSERLTFRSLKLAPSSTLVSNYQSTNTVRYAPVSQYSATMATPVSLRTQPVVNVNYIPSTHALTPYQATSLHLADEVPTSNYQGSLSNPIIYQTGHWNVDINR